MTFQKGHKINIGRKASVGTRKKMSQSKIGNTNGLNNKGWLLGKKGYTNSGSFKKGIAPWCKGKKGIHLSPSTEFKKGLSGSKSGHWQGGRIKHDLGYILIYSPTHPHRKGMYVFEHRLVVEKIISRYLKSTEPVHHLGEKDDNRPHRLMCFKDKNAHNRFHKDPKTVKRSEIIYDGRNKKSR